MPIDPYFLDKERRKPVEEVPATDYPRWILAGTTIVVVGLFCAAWFSETWVMIFLGAMVVLIGALGMWMVGSRVEQDGFLALYFRRSILTDIALGEHDKSAVPSMLMALTIVLTVAAAILLVGRHGQVHNASNAPVQQSTP